MIGIYTINYIEKKKNGVQQKKQENNVFNPSSQR